MSTILKALRKIENETDADDLSSLAWPGPVQVRQKADERMRIKKIRIRALCGLGILILVFSGTWYFSHRSAGAPSAVVFKDHAVPPPPMTPTVDGDPGGKDFPPFEEDGLAVAKADKEPFDPFPPAESDLNLPRPNAAAAPSPKHHEVSDIQSDPAENIQPAVLGLETRHDSRIELQAIAWSPDPADSFAVINNRILHEGQSFDGITITRIGRDDVAFQEMGREWREDFRLK